MARDLFHDLVRAGLEAEGWLITNDPYTVVVDDLKFQIDLAAERVIAAEKGQQKD